MYVYTKTNIHMHGVSNAEKRNGEILAHAEGPNAGNE